MAVGRRGKEVTVAVAGGRQGQEVAPPLAGLAGFPVRTNSWQLAVAGGPVGA
ncbi:MAG: hypothetical protein IIA60_14785 [Candidatus Marinimicrobia bacterium]|nr:hypothetical protein [Candidatus Neomarinimicrobiota bacterium]